MQTLITTDIYNELGEWVFHIKEKVTIVQEYNKKYSSEKVSTFNK